MNSVALISDVCIGLHLAVATCAVSLLLGRQSVLALASPAQKSLKALFLLRAKSCGKLDFELNPKITSLP